ncbi:hypothetical protein CRYPA_1450 [uncultured Candidatus Thioglobus sp.]|nr:hypothetical protein CRYPA_1450 [uncultured Candidatus Thioglobus sp.]
MIPKRHIKPNIFTSIPTQALICLSVEIITIKPKIKAEDLKTTRGPSKRLITRRNFGEDFHFPFPVEELFPFKNFEKKRLENLISTLFFSQKKLFLLKRQPRSKIFFILSVGIHEFNLFHIKETGLPPHNTPYSHTIRRGIRRFLQKATTNNNTKRRRMATNKYILPLPKQDPKSPNLTNESPLFL